MLFSISEEVTNKARKIRSYLNQPQCKFAVWEVREAASHQWPHLSLPFLKRIEAKVTELDAEYYRKKHGYSHSFDELLHSDF